MGLMCRQPRWTCFSVAVKRPIRDISFRTRQVGSDSNSVILVFKDCYLSKVGLTLPSVRSNW